jgi:hypothetical protein
MNLSFLDDIFKPVGKGLSEVDRFVDREMPFDSGWGFPAAVAAAIAASIYAPQTIPAMLEVGGEAGAAEGASAVGGESFLGMNSFLDPSVIMNATEGAEGSIGSGGMNSLLSSLGLNGGSGSFAGQEAFQLPMQSYTPDYLNSLANYNNVDAGNPSFLDNLFGNNEQGLYKQEGLAKQASGQSLTDLLKKKQQQSALDQLGKSGSKMQEQNNAQQADQNRMAQLQAMMRQGQGVDTTTALLSLLKEREPQSKQPRISLI